MKTSRLRLIIRKNGKRIEEIRDVLQDKFGLERPQIEINEIQNSDFNAQIMVERLAYSLDRGRHYRRAAYYILRKIMNSKNAIGAEVRISGKLQSQKARTQIFTVGSMTKSTSHSKEGVDKGVAQCNQKPEILVVVVKIQYVDTKMGNKIKDKDDLLSSTHMEVESELAYSKFKNGIKEKKTKLTKEDKKTINELDKKTNSENSFHQYDDKR